MKPLVAVVGRTNVGKSTFFNRILGKRISIVEDIPGVTRDRIYGDTEWTGRPFTLIDTGGLELSSQDVLYSHMREQATLAAETADVILFFLDGQQGLTAEDHEVAQHLRRTKKPVILVVNKIDSFRREHHLTDYYELGMGQPYAISSAQGLGLGDLLDAVVDLFPPEEEEEAQEESLKLAVVGRPNVGKSSLVNRILGEERVIVSEIAGTTRDAIDTPFARDGQRYMLIDTAGMRRRGKIEKDSLERYSVVRSLTAIRRADVALLMIDATEGVAEQDAKIAGYILEEGKPVVVLVNKWDAIEKDDSTMRDFEIRVRNTLSFLQYAPILFISCRTGQRVDRVLAAARTVHANARRRITTGLLNDVIRDAAAAMQPPATKTGKRAKILYVTQARETPPTFVFFVNDADLMHYSYLRYLENHLRKSFDFTGVPLRMLCRTRQEKEQ
ncbi:MAG: ribosome biogenesis GTPase Der [Christensenellales bacterium]|jgi:GTP-binding protein